MFSDFLIMLRDFFFNMFSGEIDENFFQTIFLGILIFATIGYIYNFIDRH